MARRHADEEDEFDNIRPGDIDDVFELDDEGFDIESEGGSEESSEPSDEEETTDDYEDFTYDPNENVSVEDENPDVEIDEPETSDESEKPIEDIIDEESVNDNLAEPEKEEVKEEITEESEVKTEEVPVAEEVTETHEEKNVEEKESEPEVTEVVTTEEETSEIPSENVVTEEPANEVVESSEEKEDDIPDEIKNIVDEEIHNKESISEEEIPDEVKQIAEDLKDESPMPEIETPSDIKAKEEKAEQEAKENSEEDYSEFMIKSFKTRVKDIYDRYHEQDLLNYIKEFGDKDNKEVIKDIYIQEFVKYSMFVDFNKHPEAKEDLWVLSVGVFADMIEGMKHSGKIESSVVANEHGVSKDIVPDENIEAIKAHKRQQNEKYAEYQLDRTIFNISEDEDEANCSIFDDKKTLHKDFYESEFYKIHKEVMTSDRFADMSKVEAEVLINERTSYIPIIDYSTGVRVICIDPTDTDQYHLNPMLIHKRVPFAFGNRMRNVKLRVLYRDDCKNCPIAVVSSLKKIIAYKFIKDRYKISLNRNYTIGYTTEPKYINMFNSGDPDSHSPENCPTAHEKPFNLQIGIIVLDKKSENDRRAIRRNQIRRDLGQYEKVSVEDYDIQFVLSANIIKNDLRLRNPTLPAEERYVEYLITQYTECNPVIINDGLQVISACIIKEHLRNYDAGTGYSISLEYDRDGLISPAIIGMLDERDGISPTLGAKNNSMDVDGQFVLPQSRLKLDGVFPFEKGRIDKRFFSPATVQRKYPRELWQNYDLTSRDGRIEFIRSRGFEEFIHMKPVQFDIEPYALNMIYSSDMIRNITRISMEMLADRNSEDTEAMLFKQSELEYIKSMGNDKISSFQKFLFSALDYILDQQSISNKR